MMMHLFGLKHNVEAILMSSKSGVELMYEWLKVLHIISFVAWFAGLYLPRLFVYHTEMYIVNLSAKLLKPWNINF